MIRLAEKKDIPVIGALYNEVSCYLEATRNLTGWKPGEYPDEAVAEEDILAQKLWIWEEEGTVLGCVTTDQNQAEVYKTVRWRYPASDSQVLAVHRLAVSPRAQHKGVGKILMDHLETVAAAKGCTVIRFDTSVTNFPAIRLYHRCGYELTDIVTLGLPGPFPKWFRCYEKKL